MGGDADSKWTWQECCEVACVRLNKVGLKQATSYKTVAKWNQVFRELENFPHPNLYVQSGKRPMPRLFETFPEAKDRIVTFAVDKLATLTIEKVHEFIVDKLVPDLFVLWKADEIKSWDVPADYNEASLTLDAFLKAHALVKIGRAHV